MPNDQIYGRLAAIGRKITDYIEEKDDDVAMVDGDEGIAIVFPDDNEEEEVTLCLSGGLLIENTRLGIISLIQHSLSDLLHVTGLYFGLLVELISLHFLMVYESCLCYLW